MKNMLRFLIVIGVIVYCLAFQGERGLWRPDESRYTAVAMEMLHLGDWLVPHLHWEHPHWTKPPLTYWAIASSVSLFGRSEFAARLPSALSFLFTIYLVYLLGRLFLARRSWLAPLVYASFLLPAAASNIISTDGLLTLWETSALCAYAYATWGKDVNARPKWMLLMWAAFGLAFLTKGPPGLLPLAAIAAHRFWSGRSSGDPSLRWLPGLSIFMLVGLSWFAVVMISNPELLRYFMLHEVYGRVVTGEHGRNSEWYKAVTLYLPVLILGSLPWTIWLARYLYNSAGTIIRSRGRITGVSQEQDLFLLLWFVVPLLIFLVSSSRLPLYLLPLFVPLALLAARGLEARSFIWSRRWQVGLSVWCILLVCLRLVTAAIPTDRSVAALAKAIRACDTTPYTEIAFYISSPVYGLNFYLNAEVESVTTGKMDDEFDEDETILWALSPDLAEQFLQATSARGKKMRKVCSIDERYLLFQRNSPGAEPGGK